VLECVADLVVSMPGLQANLLARIIGVKEEGLNTNSLIASKLWALLLRNRN
jgi:hypothetical protein